MKIHVITWKKAKITLMQFLVVTSWNKVQFVCWGISNRNCELVYSLLSHDVACFQCNTCITIKNNFVLVTLVYSDPRNDFNQFTGCIANWCHTMDFSGGVSFSFVIAVFLLFLLLCSVFFYFIQQGSYDLNANLSKGSQCEQWV